MKPKSNCLAVALLIALSWPLTLWVQGDTLYVSSVNGNKVYRVFSDGTTNSFANISLLPEGLAFSRSGVLYVANDGANLVNRVGTSGTVSVFATNVAQPYGLAFDTKTNLYEASNSSNRVRKITPQGAVTNFGPFITAPYGIAIDAADNVYVSSSSGFIYKIIPDGSSSPFAFVNGAAGLTFDRNGNLCVAASSGTIVAITPAGITSTFKTGLAASLIGLAFDNAGNLYAASYFGTIYKITPDLTTTTFATVSGSPSFLAVYPVPKFNPGPISLTRTGDDVVVSWFGNFVLQSATDVTGPYADVLAATSPYTNAISSANAGFFRLRN